MKTLQDFKTKPTSEAMAEAGAFFAFSNKQFYEKRDGSIKYKTLGNGLICPHDKCKDLVDALKEIHTKAIEQDVEEHGKEAVILRELVNQEAFYVYSIQDTCEALEDYPTIANSDVLNVFNHNLSKYAT